MNNVPVNTGTSLYNLANHKIMQFFTQLTPATPFVLILFGGLIALAVGPCIAWAKMRFFGIDEAWLKEMIIDQDVDAYFDVLKKKTRQHWIKEEHECSVKLEMPRLKPEVFLDLRNTKDTALNKNRPKLQGIHNYDILSNPFYAEKYLYIPAIYPVRSKFAISRYTHEKDKDKRIHSTNLVRYVVDLPYLHYKRAKEMEFNTEYLTAEYNAKDV